MPLPPVDSIVNVYETTVPSSSATVRCVVERSGWSSAVAPVAPAFIRASVAPPSSVGSPGATGLVAACVGLISARRSSAKDCDSSPASGTSTNAGSPTYRLRSANAKREASKNQWYCCVRVSEPKSGTPSTMLSASPTVEPPDDGGAMP